MSIFSSSNINEGNIYYKLSSKLSDEIVLYHHLGLGDHIICNGLVNYLSENYFKKINLITNKKFKKSLSYLYRNNENINLVEVDLDYDNNADTDVFDFANKRNLQILKIGWDKVGKTRFFKAFYKQLGLPYNYSYRYFYIDRDYEKEKKLEKHLLEYYEANGSKYNLIHSEASKGNFELKIENNNRNVFVTKESDIFNNLFLYYSIAEKAEKIHCINSSFVHFVDRIKVNSELIYHDLIGSRLDLVNKWKFIEYEN
tara:strand:- start:1181 stop:1948 length:768 start_codon:yes stop_codon:yes gene_type:complete